MEELIYISLLVVWLFCAWGCQFFFLPKGTRYKGLGLIMIECPPQMRTLLEQGAWQEKFRYCRRSFPHTLFIIQYIPIGIWPVRIFFVYSVKIGLLEHSLRGLGDWLEVPDLGNVSHDYFVCMGEGFYRGPYYRLSAMTSNAISHFWQSEFISVPRDINTFHRRPLNNVMRHRLLWPWVLQMFREQPNENKRAARAANGPAPARQR